jgi:hypothetical protein
MRMRMGCMRKRNCTRERELIKQNETKILLCMWEYKTAGGKNRLDGSGRQPARLSSRPPKLVMGNISGFSADERLGAARCGHLPVLVGKESLAFDQVYLETAESGQWGIVRWAFEEAS